MEEGLIDNMIFIFALIILSYLANIGKQENIALKLNK